MQKDQTAHALSVVPPRALLNKTEKIRWVGHVAPRTVQEQLPLANEVNKHEFKPAFVRRHGELICYVAGPDGRDQVLRAWHLLALGEIETLEDSSSEVLSRVRLMLTDAIRELPETPQAVLIARLDSFLFARDLAARLDAEEITLADARNELVGHETRRLHNEFRSELRSQSMVSNKHSFARTAWLPKEGLLVVNLPWGPKLSVVVAEVLEQLKADIILVGGAGATSAKLPVEGIFLASSIRTSDGVERDVRNFMLPEIRSLGVDYHTGCLGSTASALYSETVEAGTANLDAIETEIAHMFPWFDANSVGLIHYIMDNAAHGEPLSKTYYDRQWLNTLTRKTRRAKNLCYAAVLSKYGVGARYLVDL